MSPSPVTGLHHVTAIAADAQTNRDFYARALGQRLVKRTVNFDAPGVHHLYYGDGTGTPGTVLTVFPFPGARPAARAPARPPASTTPSRPAPCPSGATVCPPAAPA